MMHAIDVKLNPPVIWTKYYLPSKAIEQRDSPYNLIVDVFA
jgi:hypothetical protein